MNPDPIERDYQQALRRIREAKDTRATSLDFSGLIWDRLPRDLLELTWLEELALQQSGKSWENPKGTIPLLPQEFAQLPGLRHLNISRLGIQNFAPLAALKQLTTLHCGDNRLTDLAVIKSAVLNGQIQEPHVFNNPVVGIPYELLGTREFDNVASTLREYWLDMAQGSAPNRDVKVLLVGNGCVGKSTLAHGLRMGARPPRYPSASGPMPSKLTQWRFLSLRMGQR